MTRIPFGPQSIAKHRVNISKPAFETQYGNESGNCVREKVFIPYFSCVLCPNIVAHVEQFVSNKTFNAYLNLMFI